MSYVAKNHPQQVGRRGANDLIDDRATPWELFDPLHAEFGFTIDAAASAHNARLPRFWTRSDDALAQDWTGERVWCNPPYSDIGPWVLKAWQGGAQLVVMLACVSERDIAQHALSTTEAALADANAEIERMKAACQHSSQTLEGEGLLRCELCGAVERDPFWRNPA